MDNKELREYRQRLLTRLASAADEFRAACVSVQDITAPVEDGWNVHQIAVHVRDVDRHVYGMRVRRTLEENQPEFPNFDSDAWMAEHYDPSEPLGGILDSFSASIRDLVARLEQMPEDGWNRSSRHVFLGEFALQAWVERGLAHIEEHLATVKKAA